MKHFTQVLLYAGAVLLIVALLVLAGWPAFSQQASQPSIPATNPPSKFDNLYPVTNKMGWTNYLRPTGAYAPTVGYGQRGGGGSNDNNMAAIIDALTNIDGTPVSAEIKASMKLDINGNKRDSNRWDAGAYQYPRFPVPPQRTDYTPHK